MEFYDHQKIERKWQKEWKKKKLYKVVDTSNKPKCYVLDMFPYPSGDGLHVGHPKGYIATDVYSRYKRMKGFNTLHPMGWDAFGLPAENYAIANKIHPSVAVERNIKRFKEQLEIIGFNYDWDREIKTTDPEYYKWTQWIFREMFKAGLAFRSEEPINWCPSCKTGLANEDLDDGKCERCGSVVVKRPIPQWVLRITDYAERLLTDLDALNWPEHIKESQRNWIGRSAGVNLKFKIKDLNIEVSMYDSIPQTFMAQTFTVIAPEHALLPKLVAGTKFEKPVLEFAKKIVDRKAKGGFDHLKEMEGIFTGRYLTYEPTGKDIPIWVASYAVADYGTGIVNCSAHDERDFAFAKKYDIPLHAVLVPEGDAEKQARVLALDEFYREQNGILLEPKEFKGRRWDDVRLDIIEYLVKKGWGEKKVNYKLRDWVFSRQRYWGEPFPLVFCESCKRQAEIFNSQFSISKQSPKDLKSQFSKGELLNPGWMAIPEKDLPVELPKVKYYEPTGTGESPLANIEKWVAVTCPKCGGKARHETNTMPQWAGSCWYYLRYADAKNKKRFADAQKEKYWMPVDLYVGGAEHATRHLIYARFWHKFLFDQKIVSTSEPFTRLQNVGLIQAQDGRKMSKRFGNVINPDEIVEKFGADTLRVYEMFMGPFGQAISWSTDSMIGMKRFMERVWKFGMARAEVKRKKETATAPNAKLESLLHRTIRKVGEDIEGLRFNTAVSSLMVLLNELEKEAGISKEYVGHFLKMLSPFAPHITEELWSKTGGEKSVHEGEWPTFDEAKAQTDGVVIAVQINGKTRATFEAERGLSDDAVKKQALSLEGVAKWVAGKDIRKTIVVRDRLINFVAP